MLFMSIIGKWDLYGLCQSCEPIDLCLALSTGDHHCRQSSFLHNTYFVQGNGKMLYNAALGSP